jgi:hypothetical protein
LRVEPLERIFYKLNLTEIRGAEVINREVVDELTSLAGIIEGVLSDIGVCLEVER